MQNNVENSEVIPRICAQMSKNVHNFFNFQRFP